MEMAFIILHTVLAIALIAMIVWIAGKKNMRNKWPIIIMNISTLVLNVCSIIRLCNEIANV